MVGNLLIIISTHELVSYLGSYIYFLGMDFTVVCLLRFSMSYCSISYMDSKWRLVVNSLVAIDVIQLLANPIFGQAFYLEPIMVDGSVYYALVALFGQTFHRVVAYGIFFASLITFIIKTARAPHLYRERFLVILLVMILAGGWETYYIFSRAPIDRSMIGFGVFGLLVFYFSLYYRPVRLLDRMLSGVVERMGEGLLFLDADDKCVYTNDAAQGLLGFEASTDLLDVSDAMRQILGEANVDLRAESNAEHKVVVNGEERFWQVRVSRLEDANERGLGSYITIRDATEEKKQLARERFLANHDRLTGLYNKEHLYEKIEEALRENPDVTYAIVGMDIKDFKLVNDIFSKEFGDRLLRWVAACVDGFAEEGSVHGRISGDRFGIAVPLAHFDSELINNRLLHQIFVDEETGIEYPIVIHMGVYEVRDISVPVSIMFDRAFMSISTIKGDYQRHVAFYDDAMRDDVLWRQTISGELDEAIAQGQICPYLQPMVDKSGNIVGAEALVRWIHPTEGFLSPARFIPVFEENGMIARLDKYMWECACRLLKDWEKRGIDLFLSVNISPKDFYFIDVYKTISELVKKHEISPGKLRLEITETVMMRDIEKRLRIIESLRKDGFLVEMDDFGSGYSSLNMLKDIPVDVLKIDMMFLYKTKDQGKAHTILQTIINLSDDLGIPSITEGVETADQRDMLVNMGCNMFQGYFFAKPMPVEEFEKHYKVA